MITKSERRQEQKNKRRMHKVHNSMRRVLRELVVKAQVDKNRPNSLQKE